MDYKQFLASLECVLEAKWPRNIQKHGMSTAVAKLLKSWVLPFANLHRSRLPRPVDGLYTTESLATIRRLDDGLKARQCSSLRPACLSAGGAKEGP